ncbi:hypothetical protein MMC07_000771 [Pseudocyphellaria aurata]|nr:hypothetical protein [Pseudocyphellaria aurata]
MTIRLGAGVCVFLSVYPFDVIGDEVPGSQGAKVAEDDAKDAGLGICSGRLLGVCGLWIVDWAVATMRMRRWLMDHHGTLLPVDPAQETPETLDDVGRDVDDDEDPRMTHGPWTYAMDLWPEMSNG